MERIAKLREYLVQQPNDSFLKHALALELIKVGNVTEAEQLFTTLLANEPGYVGSYYHLGKLLENTSRKPEALVVYEKGMAVAKAAKDNHAYNELRGVYDDLMDD